MYGTIAGKMVRIAKRNMEKVLNGPVRRQQALEQETHEQCKSRETSRSKLTAHFLYVFPHSKYMKFIHSRLSFYGLHSAVILGANCSSE